MLGCHFTDVLIDCIGFPESFVNYWEIGGAAETGGKLMENGGDLERGGWAV